MQSAARSLPPARRHRCADGTTRLGLVVAAGLALVTPAAAQGEDPFIDDFGPGWVREACPPDLPVDPDAPVACYESEAGEYATIHLLPMLEGVTPTVALSLIASTLGGTPFDLPASTGATGRVLVEDPATLVVAAVTPDLVVQVFLSARTPVSPEMQDTISAAARRQQERAGGAPFDEQEVLTEDEAELDRLLVERPEEPGAWAIATMSLQDSFEDVRDTARSQRALELTARSPVRIRVFGWEDGWTGWVMLNRLPFDTFAASALAGARVSDSSSVEEMPGLDRIPDAVAYQQHRDATQGIVFRRGPILAFVSVAPPAGSPDQPMQQRLLDLAVAQAERLPDGATGPYSFPPTSTSVTLSVLSTTAVCLGVIVVGRVSARGSPVQAPRRAPTATPAPGDVHDVDPEADRLRRQGWVLVVVQVLAVNLVVLGALVLEGAIELPLWAGVGLVGLGLVGGIGWTAVQARHERPSIGDVPEAWERPHGAAGLVVGAVGLAMLVGGMVMGAVGLAALVFGPSVRDLEWAQDLGIAPDTLGVGAVAAGLALLVLGGLVLRLGRRLARASAARLRQRDRRPPILYLRSFEDDDLGLPTVASARHPFPELFLPNGSDPFEEAVAWELTPYGPVVAVGRPGRSLASLGAARDHLTDETWREGVADRMSEARAIVVVLGATEGVRWEVAHLVRDGHLAKTAFVFPPVDADTISQRWRFTLEVLSDAGAVVPPLPADPTDALVASLDPRGQWHVAVAGRRDEATYRAALDRALAWVSVGASPVTAPA